MKPAAAFFVLCVLDLTMPAIAAGPQAGAPAPGPSATPSGLPTVDASTAERPEVPPRSLPPLTLRVPVQVSNLHPDIGAVGVSCTAIYGSHQSHRDLVPSSHETEIWSDAWMRYALIAYIPVSGGAASTEVLMVLPEMETPPLTGWECTLWVRSASFEEYRGGPSARYWIKASSLETEAELYHPTPGTDFRFSDSGSF